MQFDLKKAEKVRDFCEQLVFSKGKWAGKPFKLLEWQWERVIKPLFGTLRDDGLRQYRFCYIEVPKKNGKTELGAAIALYMLTSDGEGSPEVFSAAADREQASLIYGPAGYMVRHNDTLSARCVVLDSQRTIKYPPNNGAYKVLSAETYCVHPDTMFELKNGGRIPARLLKNGLSVLGWNKDKIEFGNVLCARWQSPEMNYRITTNRGRKITVTPNHKFLTMLPGRRPQDLTHKYEWKNADDIVKGDRVKVALGWPSNSKKFDEIEASWSLGAWIGDGECGRFRFINEDDAIVQRLRKFVELKGGTLNSYVSTRQKQKGNHDKYPQEHLVSGNGKGRKSPFREWLKQHYGQNIRSHTKRVPSFILEGGPEAWAAFLAGWMDTDGCVPKTVNRAGWCSVSDGLLSDGQELLARLGINSIIWRNLLNVSGREQLAALYDKLSPFMSNVNKLKKFESKSKIIGKFKYHANDSDKVVSVEIIQPEQTISVEVDKIDTHITNGIVTHNTKHGLSPSAILFDELHAQPDDSLWRVLTAGTDYARQQQLIFVMTTAGIYDVNSIWWRIRSKAIQIASGLIQQDDFLPVLYIADPEKDSPDDEAVWIRNNPSIGKIFTLGKIRKDYETARQDPVEFQDFLRFRLNIPIKQTIRWMPMDDWDKCGGDVDLEALKGLRCYGGLDMSTKIDLTALVLVFPPQIGLEKWTVLVKCYCPEDTVMQRSRSDRVHYEVWQKQNLMTATPGNVIDEGFIERDILEVSQLYDLAEVGYDPWGATAIATRIFNDNDIKMVEVRQGAKSLSEPAKDLLVKIKKHEVNHGGHPVLRWCADNLVMVRDANENVRPDKEKATDRIDAVVALIIAWGRAIFAEPQYDEPRITVIGGRDDN